MRTIRILIFAAVTLSAWLGACCPLAARPLAMNHMQWGPLVGAPTQIQALAQGKDGFLWLGTASGLYRFDGQTFEHIPRIPGDRTRAMLVTALLAAANGDIWVGHDYGGLAIYRHGRLLDGNHGPPTGRVRKIIQAADGAIWVLTNGLVTPGVTRYANGRWETFGTERGLSGTITFDLAADPDGSVIAVQSDGIRRLRPGQLAFERMSPFQGKQPSLARDHDGSWWIGDNNGLWRLGPNGSVTGKPWTLAKGLMAEHQLNRDRSGNLWVLVHGAGVARIVDPNALATRAAETFTAADGLTSSVPLSFLQDAEGTIWIGTLNGLDRFRPSIFHAVKELIPTSELSFTMQPGPKSGIVVASQPGLFALDTDQSPRFLLKTSTTWEPGLCGTPDNLFVANDTNLVSVRPDGRTTIAPPKLPPSDMINLCAVDGRGRLWISVIHKGLFVRDSERWRHVAVFPGLPSFPFAMTTDRKGAVLLNYPLRAVVRIDGNHMTKLLSGPNMPVGFVKAMQDSEAGLFIGGDQGLALVRDGKVRTLRADRYPWLRDVTGITVRDGQVLLIGGDGVARLPLNDLLAAFGGTALVLRPQIFGISDGLPGRAQRYGTSDITFDRAGNLWVATIQGLAWARPHDLMIRRTAIPVVIRNLRSGKDLFRDPSNVTLPAGTRNVAIDFAALALSAPESARLRYRLVGTENWTEAGERRQMNYSNLTNGTFHFEVASANADGVWSERPTTLVFTIPPTFVQSRTFLVICIAAIVAALALLYNVRLRIVSKRIRDRMRLQLMERERIAQDLHDTLLQSIQGLIIRFHGVAMQPDLTGDVRGLINETLDQAEAALIESREQVAGLRSARIVGLHRRIEEVAEKLATNDVAIVVEMRGEERLLEPIVAEEAAKIAGEALYNAVQHARAGRIEISVEYLPERLVVRIVDDGRGIDADILARGREGHFGLRGMSERAVYASGHLGIDSAPDRGTRITLQVPAKYAYRQKKRSWFWFLQQAERKPLS